MTDNLVRVKTGIPGFDELIEGGIPKGRTILVSGGTGSGKSIFSMQFIYQGALAGEAGIYVTLDERASLLREDCAKFNWNLEKLENSGMLSLIDGSVAKIGLPTEEKLGLPATGFDLDKLLLEILRIARRTNAKRCVIDNIPSLGLNFEGISDVRKSVLKMAYIMTRAGMTSILITEVEEGSKQYGRYGVEEFVVDGVISLHYMAASTGRGRTMHIRKMRATKHSEDIHPMEIGKDGIKIHRIEDEF